jgi:hypothetical protein
LNNFKFILALLITLTVHYELSVAQQNGNASKRSIKSSNLQEEALRITGNTQFWPIVSSSAEYDAEQNVFVLTKEKEDKLSALTVLNKINGETEQKYRDLLKNGAKVFIPDLLLDFEKKQNRLNQAIRDGEFETVVESIKDLAIMVKKLAETVNSKRIERVAAILAEKSGSVSQRKGLLGTWNESDKGDLYKEADGIKTEKKSVAKLDFVDGSYVIVDPETIAQVRSASIDKLYNAATTEIEITTGGVLASMSAEARKSSSFSLKAAQSNTSVNSSKFWAKKDDQESVTLSNYDGNALVRAGSKQVELAKDEGTVIVRGQDPLPPVKLLRAPLLTWPKSDSVTYNPSLTIEWTAISNAEYYEVDVSSSSSFSYQVKTYKASGTSTILNDIQEGTHYIRVRAFDKLKLRGLDSPVYRLLKNKDVQAPAVFLKNGNEQVYYTSASNFIIKGITEPNCSIQSLNKSLRANQKGEFEITFELNKEKTNIEFSVADFSGNKTTIRKEIVKMSEKQLFNLSWSVPVKGNVIKKADLITLSGQAYPQLTAEVETNNRVFRAECGQNGEWSLQLLTEKSNELILRFIDKQTGNLIAEKNYVLE